MDATITIIASLTALAAVVFAPLVSIQVAKMQISAQVVATNRQVWINRLREELAYFIREVRHIPSTHSAQAINTHQAIARHEDLVLKEEIIRLMLNPQEEDHKEQIQLLASAREKTRQAINASNGMAAQQDQVAEQIVAIAQRILKAEWIRVKTGA